MPTSESVALFLDHLRTKGASDKTVKQYESNLNRVAQWLADNAPPTRGDRGVSGLEKSTQIDLANFKRLAGERWKPSTVRQTLTHLSAYLDFLVANGQIPDNPVKHLDRITVTIDTPKWLDRNQQNALLRAARSHGDLRELTLITLLLHTGLRVEEVCDLRVDDLVIRDRSGRLTVRNGKYGRRREIPLNVDARRVLSAWLADRAGTSPYVFDTQRSEQMTTRAVQHIFTKYRKLTEIDHLSAHALRHTFGHELVSNGTPLDVAARLMGHVKADGTPNIQMTARYTLPGAADLERAVNGLSWV